MFAPPVAKQKTKSAEHQRAPVVPQRPGQPAVSQVQMLQRRIGNQALLRLLAQRGNEPSAHENAAALLRMLQPKLKIGAVNDPLEHEADRVADQVMRMPAPEVSAAAVPPQVSRKCAECGEEEHLQKKEAGTEGTSGEAPGSVHEVLRSPGQPLDASSRAYFEPRFGQDFSHVRAHTGAAAEQSAREVNANAYTVGHNMVFGAGRFAPGTDRGRALIAHELAHVVQQGFGAQRGAVQLQPVGTKKSPSPDPLEAKKKEALAAVGAIESSWKPLATVSAPYKMLKPWIAHGDAIVAMIRTHTNGALDAMQAGDAELVAAYTFAAKTDKISIDYVAWHVTAYVNLLSVESDINGLINSFDHDNRAFTGRKNAERITRELKKAIDGLQSHSDQDLKLIRTDKQLGVRSGTPRQVTITVTNPALDVKIQQTFENLTAGMQKLQENIQQGVEYIDQFLDNAFDEGLQQAVDALEEYYKVKKILGGGGKSKKEKREEKKKEKKKEKKEEAKPDIQPVPPIPVEDPERGPGGRWGCDDVRCNVYPDPNADSPNPNCPPRVIGSSRGWPNFAMACLAAERHANSQVPRGCIKRHCNCETKCRQM